MPIASREDLKNYCLRKLGEPVIKVNVEASQIEDRIDEAFQYWYDFHYDAIERYYFKHQLTQEDVDTQQIIIYDPLIISVERCFPIDQETLNIFDIRYQIRLNDFYDFNNVSIIHYDMTMEHLALLDFFFTTKKQFRFNRHQNIIKLDFDPTESIDVGQYIIFECRRCVDPTLYSDVYNDRWLKEYLTELIREQWGENLKKFGNIELPGGVILNGQQIFDEALANKEKLERQLREELQEPPSFILG